VLKLYRAYDRSIQRLCAQLSLGINTNDLETIERSAHDIKSSSATLGLVAIATLAQAIEQAARTRNPFNYAQSYQAILSHLATLEKPPL